MRTYNLLFKMPEDKELFIAAWSAINHYDRMLRFRGIPLQITVVVKEDDWLSQLLIPPMIFVIETIEEVIDQTFDLSVDLSDDRILELGKYGKKASSICGALIGIEGGINELPTISASKPKFDLYIIPWSTASLHYFEDSKPKLNGLNVHISTSPSIKDKVWNSKIVLGYRSVETYLASCMHRIVIEGYDLETYDRNFLSKWSNKTYNMVFVEKKEHLDKNLSLMWRALERAINVIQRVPRTESVTYSNTES